MYGDGDDGVGVVDNADNGRGQGEDGREEASSLEAAMDLAMMADEIAEGDDGDGGGDGDGEGKEDIGSKDVDEDAERDFEQQDRSREENGESSSSRPLSDSIAAVTTAAAATPLVPEERSSQRRSPLGASPSSTAKASLDRGNDGDSSGEKRKLSSSPPSSSSSSRRRNKTNLDMSFDYVGLRHNETRDSTAIAQGAIARRPSPLLRPGAILRRRPFQSAAASTTVSPTAAAANDARQTPDGTLWPLRSGARGRRPRHRSSGTTLRGTSAAAWETCL